MQAERLAQRAQTLFEIQVTAAQLEQLAFYETEMLDWNANRCNLTAITDPDDIEVRHFLDSMSVLSYLNPTDNALIADIGTGAGLPGLVMKILRPDLRMTLIESIGKKTDFLAYITRQLGLKDIEILTDRVEAVGQNLKYREQYDMVIARAVANMPILAEYTLPLCKIGGVAVAMKGGSALREVEEGNFAIEVLGGKFVSLFPVNLPEVYSPHLLVVVQKMNNTPKKYPRGVGIPAKRPLLLKQNEDGSPKAEIEFETTDEE